MVTFGYFCKIFCVKGLGVLLNRGRIKRKINKHDDEAIKAAGIDATWLLKRVVHDMARQFETKSDGISRVYKWDGDTSNDCQ